VRVFIEFKRRFMKIIFFFSFSEKEEFFGQISTIFGTSFLYIFIIPLFAALNTRLYHKTLIACIVTDFSNLLLKWFVNKFSDFVLGIHYDVLCIGFSLPIDPIGGFKKQRSTHHSIDRFFIKLKGLARLHLDLRLGT
jgi:hypothetical protein